MSTTFAPYKRSIDRGNPTCILFLVDQSNSMLDGLAASPRPKIEAVAAAVNRFLGELIAGCEKGEDKPRHYFDVGLVGYTTDQNGHAVVGPLFGGPLAGRDLVSIPDLYDNPLEVEQRTKKSFQDDGAGGLVEVEQSIMFPVWYRPPGREQMFGTPMCTALDYARGVLGNWLATHPDSFPPMVINLTDGEPTDGDPVAAADQLKELATSNGNVLLVNCHLSSREAEPVLFPTNEHQLPDTYSKELFKMASPLPDPLRGQAEIKGISTPSGCKAMAFNADAVGLLKMLSLGTIVAAGAGAGGDATLPPHLR